MRTLLSICPGLAAITVGVASTTANITELISNVWSANSFAESNNLREKHGCANAILMTYYRATGEFTGDMDDYYRVCEELIGAYSTLIGLHGFEMVTDIYNDRPNDEDFTEMFEYFGVNSTFCEDIGDYASELYRVITETNELGNLVRRYREANGLTRAYTIRHN